MPRLSGDCFSRRQLRQWLRAAAAGFCTLACGAIVVWANLSLKAEVLPAALAHDHHSRLPGF
jgi:hypothetical protein